MKKTELIDLAATLDGMCKYCGNVYLSCDGACRAKEYIAHKAPAVDAVPVVRCKDCRFYAIKQSSLCDMHNTAVNAEDYCSYGTKMDGGEHHAD